MARPYYSGQVWAPFVWNRPSIRKALDIRTHSGGDRYYTMVELRGKISTELVEDVFHSAVFPPLTPPGRAPEVVSITLADLKAWHLALPPMSSLEDTVQLIGEMLWWGITVDDVRRCTSIVNGWQTTGVELYVWKLHGRPRLLPDTMDLRQTMLIVLVQRVADLSEHQVDSIPQLLRGMRLSNLDRNQLSRLARSESPLAGTASSVDELIDQLDILKTRIPASELIYAAIGCDGDLDRVAEVGELIQQSMTSRDRDVDFAVAVTSIHRSCSRRGVPISQIIEMMYRWQNAMKRIDDVDDMWRSSSAPAVSQTREPHPIGQSRGDIPRIVNDVELALRMSVDWFLPEEMWARWVTVAGLIVRHRCATEDYRRSTWRAGSGMRNLVISGVLDLLPLVEDTVGDAIRSGMTPELAEAMYT